MFRFPGYFHLAVSMMIVAALGLGGRARLTEVHTPTDRAKKLSGDTLKFIKHCPVNLASKWTRILWPLLTAIKITCHRRKFLEGSRIDIITAHEVPRSIFQS